MSNNHKKQRIAYLTKQLESVINPATHAKIEKMIEQLTSSIEIRPSRAHDEDGHFAKDDASTPNVNEAWKGGKAPTQNKKKKKP